MALIPDPPSPTAEAIFALYARPEKPRQHLGASRIGAECSRALWYEFRWADSPDFPPRILRLFDTGKREEIRIIEELRKIGAEVHDVDPDNPKEQIRYSDICGHFGGSLDAIAQKLPEAPKTWHVIEIKTHNRKSFNDLKNHGVKKSKPQHETQMQVYMGFSDLNRAMYIAVCKDTDEIYIERVCSEPAVYNLALGRARQVIESAEPLTKISEDPSYYICKFCDFSNVCHESKASKMNCRTCIYATPEMEGDSRWSCAKHNKDLTYHKQIRGCGDHLLIPATLPFAEQIDAGEDWISYRVTETGQEFVNAAAASFPTAKGPQYSSKDVRALDYRALGDERVTKARDALEGEFVEQGVLFEGEDD